MEFYKIAGLSLRLICNENTITGIFHDQMMKFLSYETEIPNLCVQIILQNNLRIPKGKLLIDEYIKWIERSEGGYYIYSNDPMSGNVLILIETDEKWENVIIYANNHLPNYSTEEYATLIGGNIFFMLGLVFRNAILRHDGFVIHSSSIDYDGHGIIFSAPSGTGKSTHVNLWNEFYGEKTRIINDDTPAIRIINSIPYLFGSPWCGSSFKGINESVKLSAMVAIARGKTNVIRQLDSDEAMVKLMPRIFMPYYNEALMNLTINTFEKVLSKVTPYLLSCTIDRESVELVRACVK